MPSTADIIRCKRDGETLTAQDLALLVDGIADGSVSDGQIGAFVMAVYQQGMSAHEQAALTLSMRDTGTVIQWEDLDGPVLDKHSTGGVGDLVSLVLGPMIAACGGYVPTISGRGLGHTGGTLDKLESIPGFDVSPSMNSFKKMVHENRLAIVGQGHDLAPADQRIYAVRDVTATVSCIPLIVSSILSKKLAEGLDCLVLDIKTGNGAFMKTPGQAHELASRICAVAETAGLRCTALLTCMDQPLAHNVGNALEVQEAISFLTRNSREQRLEEVSLGLCIELLRNGGLEADPDKARNMLVDAIDNGSAAEHFARMVSLQGGPADLLESPGQYLPAANETAPVCAEVPGFLQQFDTRAIGKCVVQMGGGRDRVGDSIDHSVGLSNLSRIGQEIQIGEPLAIVHAANEADLQRAVAQVRAAIQIGDEPGIPAPLISDRFGF